MGVANLRREGQGNALIADLKRIQTGVILFPGIFRDGQIEKRGNNRRAGRSENERMLHEFGSGFSSARIFYKATAEKRKEILGKRGPTRDWRIARGNFSHRQDRIHVIVGWKSIGHFYDSNSKRPNV